MQTISQTTKEIEDPWTKDLGHYCCSRFYYNHIHSKACMESVPQEIKDKQNEPQKQLESNN